MNILITGGCGFIGKSLALDLSLHHNIVVIDSVISNHISGVDYFDIDLSCPSELELRCIKLILAETDIVFHFASSVGVEYIDKNPKLSLQNSLFINNILFPLFDEYGVKVIYSSSSEVYGDTKLAKETDVLKIGSPDKLRWGYACSKLMSEFLLKSYNFPHVIVRFFNITGKGQSINSGMVLPKFVNYAKNDEDIIIYGDGYQYRTFCDIRDAIEMLKILMVDDKHNGEVYNIGNMLNCYTINDLAENVIRIVDSLSFVRHINYNDKFSDQFGEIYERKPDTTKIQKYYKCRYDLTDIVRSMI